MDFLRALLGLVFFCFVAWCFSSNKKRFPWRVVLVGLALQFALAQLILGTSFGRRLFEGLAGFYSELITVTESGTQLVFGELSNPGGPAGFALAFLTTGLPVIIFFSALMAILYHIGVMQILIWIIARFMSATMGVSGAESMAVAANIFVGQTEAPLVVRPYIAKMTMSELNALMTGGFATIAGSVLAMYMGFLGNDLAPHLLTASVMSAPAAFLIAKIMQPESEEPVTGSKVELRFDRQASNLVEAAANGTSDGLNLWLNVIAMLIAFMALVALADRGLELASGWMGYVDNPLTLSRMLGWLFAPIAWVMGVEGSNDCQLFGTLLGTKVAVNEFVAFETMQGFVGLKGDGPRFEHAKTSAMAAYALCGFANFASVGIQIGGISPLAPERKSDISKLAIRAMIGGAFASWMTATVAGAFL